MTSYGPRCPKCGTPRAPFLRGQNPTLASDLEDLLKGIRPTKKKRARREMAGSQMTTECRRPKDYSGMKAKPTSFLRAKSAFTRLCSYDLGSEIEPEARSRR